MAISPTDVFALAEKRLSWIDQRQAVLAQNIANANTPGYSARDIKPFNEVLAAQAQKAASGSSQSASAASLVPLGRAAGERSINGNAVSLDEQLEKVAETDTAHQLTMNLYKKYLGMFKTAIGRN
jgi:flagellar basal-body rod protein FlgB